MNSQNGKINQDLLEARAAMQNVEKYLDASGDHKMVLAVYIPPAQQLRNAADDLEKKDAAVQQFREVLKRLHKEY